MKKISIVSCIVMLLSASPGAAVRTPVTTCGAIVSGSAELVGDLDCSAYTGSAVVILGRGSLRMNGFTISANTSMQDVDLAGIECRASIPGKTERCKIYGPGTITGGTIGIDGGLAPCISDVTVVGAGTVGVLGGKAVIRGSSIEGNGFLAVQYEGGGVRASSVALSRSEVTGNAEHGVWANGGRFRLIRSSVVDNGTSPSCAVEPNLCADLISYDTPRLRESTCGTSKRVNHTTLGVCAND